MRIEKVRLYHPNSIIFFKSYECIGFLTLSTFLSQKQQINMRLEQSQVSPQLVAMSFLPGEEKMVDVEVFAPNKGPLDLYILMDFSNSMADDLISLKNMGKRLGEHLY